MSNRKFRRLAILAKIETAYATDSVPVAATDAMLVRDATITPLAGEEAGRDLILPWLGHQGVELTGNHARVEFSVEVAGSAGAAGTVPAYGALLRACGLSQTITAGQRVTYAPVSGGEESASIYWLQDGVRHVLLGCRGTVRFEFTVKQIPVMRFTFTGLLGTVTDQALPAATYTGFRRPVPVSNAVTTLSLHGIALVAERVSLDLGNSVETRFLIGKEQVDITDRQATGQVTIEAPLVAAKNWFAAATARDRGSLTLQHGTVAGNIFAITAAQAEVGRPTQGQSQGIITYDLPLMLCAAAGGGSDVVIEVR